MEFINKIEIRGIVGKCESNIINEMTVLQFSVVTDYCKRDINGNSTIETNWFHVSFWSKKYEIIRIPQKGDWVSVKGRIRQIHYTNQEGNDRYHATIVANEYDILPKEEEKQ